MTTPKRSLPFKNLVVEPLNWVAPKSAAQEPTGQTEDQEKSVDEQSSKS